MIPWQRMSGEEVERLVAALIAVDHPRANRITPSRGDRGVDIRERLDDGSLVIYQVKRYTGPLTSSQATEVEKSLHTLLDKLSPHEKIARWHLVMPWNPTPERIQWLENDLAPKIAPAEIRWDDEARLDAWAAGHPDVVAHLTPGAAAPRDELLTEALRSRLPADLAQGETLLEAAIAHARLLQRSLDRVDPFYSYEVRHFDGADAMDLARAAASPDAAVTKFVSLEGGGVRSVALFPRTDLSAEVSPISWLTEFIVNDDTRAALIRFHEYGTPLVDMPATISTLSGPPGFDLQSGDVLVSLSAHTEVANLPDSEFAMIADGQEVAIIQLGEFTRTRGLDGRGVELTTKSLDGIFDFIVTMRVDADGSIGGRLSVGMPTLTGFSPRVAQRALVAVRAFLEPGTKVWRVAGGGRTLHEVVRDQTAVDLAESVPPAVVDYVDALAVVAQHTLSRVRVPALETEPARDAETVLTAAQLLRGETLHAPVDFAVTQEEWQAKGETSARLVKGLSCMIAGTEIRLDAQIIAEAPLVRAAGEPNADGMVPLEAPGEGYAIRLHRPGP